LAVLRLLEAGLRRGEIFWLRLTTARAQCLRHSERFFHYYRDLMVGRHYGTRSGEFVEFDVADFLVSGVQDKGLMWLNWAMVHLLPAVKSFLTGSLHVAIVGPTIGTCKRFIRLVGQTSRTDRSVRRSYRVNAQ